MAIHTLRCEMLTRRSLQETFAVFEDPYNLAKITPSWLSFQVTSPQRVEMRKGAEIEYKISWLGVPMHWKTIIREYEPPFLFIDEQAEGPYTLWRHRHTFQPCAEGTKVGDHVESQSAARDIQIPPGATAEVVWRQRCRDGKAAHRALRLTEASTARVPDAILKQATCFRTDLWIAGTTRFRKFTRALQLHIQISGDGCWRSPGQRTW